MRSQELHPSRICIVMASDEQVSSYAVLSRHINRSYAMKHGYGFQYIREHVTDRAPQWIKIKVLRQLLAQRLDYDYFFWIDTDAFFNRHGQTLQPFIEKYPDKSIILCSDDYSSGRTNSINTGTMFIKNDDWCLDFLNMVWNDPHPRHLYRCCHEQTSMERLMRKFPHTTRQIAIEPETSFNSYYDQILQDTVQHNFIIHLMATDASYRTSYMQRWLRNHRDMMR